MINKILGKIFTNSQETKSLIGVRKNGDEDQCWIGYIINFNEHLFVLQHISPLGLEDGLIVEKINNIDNFETEDDYVKSIQLLFDNNKKIANQNVKYIEISEEENWQYEILQSTFDQGKIISVEINNLDSIDYGFVLDYDETTLQIKGISRIGEEAGTQTYRLTDITSLGVDRIEARKREMLYIMNKTKK